MSKKLVDFSEIDTKDFCKAGSYFHTYKKYPTDNEWWDEEFRRMTNGYQVGNWKITGEHYTYLNFCRIKLTNDENRFTQRKSRKKKASRKVEQNPDFWDGDYVFYWVKYIARWGMSEEEYLKLKLPLKIKVDIDEDTGERTVGGAKNLCIAKKRRFGASYKLGSSGARNYVLIPKSLTVYAAYDNAYLLDDAIMSKLVENINFFDKHTQFGGTRLIDSDDDIQMGHKEQVNGVWVDDGNLSRVMAVSYGKNTGAVRGKDGEEIYWEESGKAPNLLSAVKAALDTTGDGDYITGQHIWFGTGGGDGGNWEGFKEIYYNPQKYNCLEIENKYDEGAVGTYAGLFIPDYWNYVGAGCMSRNGESFVDIARQIEEDYQKETFIDKGDIKGLIERKMEHPFTPMDAFAVSNSSIFDTVMIRNWREHVERNKLHLMMGNVGDIVRQADGSLKFEINEKLQPLYDYPIKTGQNQDNTGAMVMYYPPKKIDGRVPANMYIIDADTYRFDYTTGDSVGAVYVKLRSSKLVPNNLDDRIVMSYVGRPSKKDDFMKRIFYMAELYNGKIGFENDEGNSLVDYAKRFPKLRLIEYLEPQFELGYDERLKTPTTMRRSYGISMGSGKNNERVHTGDEYTKEWMEEVRGVREDGTVMLNLHTVYDLGLLKEWESYNYNNYKNYDRQAAFRVMMYHGREIVYQQRKEIINNKPSKFFSSQHQFFSNKTTNYGQSKTG